MRRRTKSQHVLLINASSGDCFSLLLIGFSISIGKIASHSAIHASRHANIGWRLKILPVVYTSSTVEVVITVVKAESCTGDWWGK